MRTVTLTADEDVLEAAEARAASESTTLDEVFREWLAEYGNAEDRMRRYDAAIEAVKGQFRAGTKFSRDAMNAR